MSASDFAPLRELAAHHALNPTRGFRMLPAELDLLARLLREHAERGEAIRDYHAALDAYEHVTAATVVALRERYDAARARLRTLSTPPTEQDDGN